MTTSLVFDEARLAAEQSIAHELDLATEPRETAPALGTAPAAHDRSAVHDCAPSGAKTEVDRSATLAQPHGPNTKPDHQAGQRQPNPPQPRTARFPDPMAFGRCAVQIGALRVCIAASQSAPPPLAKARHRGIMQCHFGDRDARSASLPRAVEHTIRVPHRRSGHRGSHRRLRTRRARIITSPPQRAHLAAGPSHSRSHSQL